MYDFDTLMNEVLENRSELSREKVLELIGEKKKTVGSGYLTDQGALFLVAGELGIQLKPVMSSDLTLKDIYAGANDITLIAKVLAVYPVMEYQRKDGTKGRYRRLNLFDKTDIVRLTIWDDNEAIGLNRLGVDSPVRIMNAYVKAGLDGKLNLNLGKRGRIETVTDSSTIGRLATLESETRSLDSLGVDSNMVAVVGTATSNGRSSDFIRNDGSQGHMVQFELGGGGVSKNTRVVIWNGSEIPEVKSGMRLRVTNVRTKRTIQDRVELHGDAGSLVQIFPGESARPNRQVTKVNAVRDADAEVNLEVMSLSKGTIRDVTLKDGSVVRKGEMVVGDETGEITVVGWRELSEQLGTIDVGEKLFLSGVTHQPTKMGTDMIQLGHSSKIERVLKK